MSVNSSAILVAGVRYSDVVSTRTESRTEIKYNQDTGVPYTKRVDEVTVHFCGKPLPAKYSDDVTDYVEDELDLEIHHTSSGKNEDGVFGFLLYEIDDGHDAGESVSVDLPDVAKFLAGVKEKLRGAGYKGEVGLYLIHQIG